MPGMVCLGPNRVPCRAVVGKLAEGDVTAVAVAGPVVLYAIVQRTGYGKWLFERPAWAHIDTPAASRTATA